MSFSQSEQERKLASDVLPDIPNHPGLFTTLCRLVASSELDVRDHLDRPACR